jgi:hypothetical protein
MKDLNEVIAKLEHHLQKQQPLSGKDFATDVIEALRSIAFRLAAIEQQTTR